MTNFMFTNWKILLVLSFFIINTALFWTFFAPVYSNNPNYLPSSRILNKLSPHPLSKFKVNFVREGSRLPTITSNECDSFYPLPPIRQPYKFPPQLALANLLQLPSNFTLGDPKFAYTIVISAWRRPNVIKRILDACVEQTHPPKEIWVSVFASPKEGEYKSILTEYKSTSKIPIKLIFGDPQLSYWGRFQLGLQITTPYTLYLDDDTIMGNKWCEIVLQMMNTKDYRGIYGLKGFAKGVYLREPISITPVDVVGGSWFIETQWLKSLWRETPFTWLTGEDYQLSYSVRKFFNIPSFVVPWDGIPETRGCSSDYLKISENGDTTLYINDGRAQKREQIFKYLRQRGYIRNDFPNKPVIAFIVQTEEDAKILASPYWNLDRDSTYTTIIISSGNAVGNEFQIQTMMKIADTNKWFNMMIALEMHSDLIRPTDIQSEGLLASLQILESMRVNVVVAVISNNHAVYAALSAADILDIPFVAIVPDGTLDLTTSIQRSMYLSAVKLCDQGKCIIDSVTTIIDDDCKWEPR